MPRIQEQKTSCFVLPILSHVLASHASETRLIRDILSGKPFRCPCKVLSIQEQERNLTGRGPGTVINARM
jgi:hypothetical protein